MRQNILLIVLSLALLGIIFVWYQYLYVGEPVAPEAVSNPFEDQLAEIRRLKDLRLDTNILQNEFFKTLQAPPTVDTTGTHPGRENPFVPF